MKSLYYSFLEVLMTSLVTRKTAECESGNGLVYKLAAGQRCSSYAYSFSFQNPMQLFANVCKVTKTVGICRHYMRVHVFQFSRSAMQRLVFVRLQFLARKIVSLYTLNWRQNNSTVYCCSSARIARSDSI